MIVRFHIVSPPSKKRGFSVRLPILLGRGEDAKFRIQHDLVSRKHCEFFAADGGVFVRDLGSTNGTFLNDEQVPASVKTPVPHGATIRVGGLSFRVEYEQSGAVPQAVEAAPQSGGGTDNPRTVAVDLRQFAPQSSATADPEVSVEQSPDEDLPLPDFTAEPAVGPAAEAVAADTGSVPADPPAASIFADAEPDEPNETHESNESRGPSSANPGADEPVFPAAVSPPAAPAGDFGFLDAASGTPAAEAGAGPGPGWPTAEDASDKPDGGAGTDDDALNSFFKGLK
jgi:pSer/pThr/pTyr-binding forkhead associated (FHA) protein